MHATPIEVRGHLEGTDPFLLACGSWDGPQAVGLGGRCLPAEPIWQHNFYFLEITYPFGESTEPRTLPFPCLPLPHCVCRSPPHHQMAGGPEPSCDGKLSRKRLVRDKDIEMYGHKVQRIK